MIRRSSFARLGSRARGDRRSARRAGGRLALCVLLASPALRAQAPMRAPAPSQQAPAAPSDEPAVEVTAPVVVTGSRTERPLSEAPVATQVIGRAEIRESGARNVAELLEEQPGVYMAPSFAGSGPELQGLDSSYTLVLVDGQRAIGRIGGVIDLRRYPLEDIERIEIVRGASSALYGADALAGVINIITRRSRRALEAQAEAGYGDRHRVDLSGRVGASGGAGWSSLSGALHRVDAYDLDPSDVTTSGSEIEQYEAALRAGRRIGEALELAAHADYRYRAQDGVDESGGGAVLDRRNRTEEATFSLRPEWTPSAETKLSLRAGYSYFRDQFMLDQRQGVALDEYQDTREQLAQGGAQLDTWLHPSHFTSVGVEGLYEHLRSERLASGRGDRQRGAIYAQDEWTLLEGPLLVLLPGARLDIDSDFGAYATPRLALRFDPTSALTLRASAGLGFRAPDFREQLLFFENPGAGYVVVGNPDLEPERSRNVTLGAELHPLREVWLSVSLFRNDLSDMISTEIESTGDAAAATRFRYENVRSAYTQGVEANLRLHPLGGLRLDFGYSFIDTKDEDLDRPLSGRPRHRATLALTHREPSIGFETVWRAALIGERTFYEDTDGDGSEEPRNADGYASVDLRVAQHVAFGASAFLLAENVLDAGDPELSPLPPRSFTVGLRFVH